MLNDECKIVVSAPQTFLIIAEGGTLILPFAFYILHYKIFAAPRTGGAAEIFYLLTSCMAKHSKISNSRISL